MKRILLAADYSTIEPLGILYLNEIAKQEGWNSKIALVKNLSELREEVKKFNPNILGYTIYAGNAPIVFKNLNIIKKEFDLVTILGGPQATYFPEEAIKYADYVVISEGFSGLRKILRGEAKPGIVPFVMKEEFPDPDRTQFYKDHPEHEKIFIKSVITKTGCPYACTYCYNSSTINDIKSSLNSEQLDEMKKALGASGRLFPFNQRKVDSVIAEIKHIKAISSCTEMIYFQDDIFGTDMEWLREFTKKYKGLLPFHAQSRFEYMNPDNESGAERIKLLKMAGCTGMTFAIESADPVVRKELLHRNMNEEIMYSVLSALNKEGFKVRTEQMLGLPLGATDTPTIINLEADLKTLELNVKLRAKTGLPSMAWASIFSPYKGTVIADHCINHGFYDGGEVPLTFFEDSGLRFPNEWVGPGLSRDDGHWQSAVESESYHRRLVLLRDLFNYFALVPEGHLLAKDFLSGDDLSVSRLSFVTRQHLYNKVLYDTKGIPKSI